MKLKKIALLLFVGALSTQSYSQTPGDDPIPQIIPVSPEAAALAKMVNYPVNLNTGIPDINIPFYEIKVGGMSLPITLNYHAGGFRINEQATRAGLGWSLSSDLQITRTVNGLDDFTGSGRGYIANTLLRTFYADYLSCTSCAYPLYSTSPFPYANAYDMAAGEIDGMPDKFAYKLLNKSGSFYFLKNHAGGVETILPVPYDNIKIQLVNEQFVITDTDGTVYYFGGLGGEDIEVSSSGGGLIRSAWKCSRIVSSTQTDEITFTYTPKSTARYRSYNDYIEYYSNESPCGLDEYYTSNNYPLENLHSYEEIEGYMIPFYEISSPKYMKVFGNNPISYFHIPYVDAQNNVVDKVLPKINLTNASQTTIDGLSLSTIVFRGGKVEFNGVDQLSSIRVLDDRNNEVKSMHFFQSFTTANYVAESKTYNGDNFAGTRYLDSLHIKNGSNVFERYALVYNDKFCYGNHLKGHDAWGFPNASMVEIAYANNTTGNILSLPMQTIIQPRFYFDIYGGCTYFASDVPINIEGDNWAQAPNEAAMKRGILKRIVYPTGGHVDFEFEANRYDEEFVSDIQSNTLPQLAGGLRIRSINYYNPGDLNQASQKYYRYGEFEQGTGVALSKPKRSMEGESYHFEALSYSQQIAYLENPMPQNACYDPSCMYVKTVETKTTYQPASTLDYTYSSGSPVYYNKVTEYQQDFGSETGKTVYEYYPPDYFYDFVAPYIAESRIPETNIPYLKTSGLMGVEKSVSTFKTAADQPYKPVHRKNYSYLRYVYPKQVRVTYSFLKVRYHVVTDGYLGNQRDLYNNSLASFNVGDEYVAGEYGIPSGKLLLSQEDETWYEDAGERTVSTTYTYDKLPYLQVSHINTTSSQDNSISRSRKYAYDFVGIAVYDQMKADNMISQLVEEIETDVSLNKELSRRKTNYTIWPVGWNLVAPATVQSSEKGQVLSTDVTFDSYDQYGNILQFTRKDGVPTSYLWGYNNRYPVAELKNITYASIPSTYKSNVQINNPDNDASLRILLNGLHSHYSGTREVSTYTYQRMVGITSQTAPNGGIGYFEYDPIGRLKLQRDHNQKVIKQYDYEMAGPSAASVNYLWSTNAPVMRYYSFPGSSYYTKQVYNLIVPGGKHNANSMEAADFMAQLEAESLTYPPPGLPPSSIKSNTAEIMISVSGLVGRSMPSNVEIDFIKDGVIVSTERVSSGTSSVTFMYLEEGIYQIVVRPSADTNYWGGFLVYSMFNMNEGTGFDFRSGDTVHIDKFKDYVIDVSPL